MSETTETLEDAIESFTGFDEIAVEAAFGRNLVVMQQQQRGTDLQRAAVFVLRRRAGDSDHAAKHHALSMTLRDLNGYFADEDDEVMPDEPTTPAGNGDSLDVSEPVSSPSSV